MSEQNLIYGIQKATIGDDNVESTYVKFGDGKTSVCSVWWEDGRAGIAITRTDMQEHEEPFAEYVGSAANTVVNELPDHEKVFLVADNSLSLDVIINRLVEAKELLQNGGKLTQEVEGN